MTSRTALVLLASLAFAACGGEASPDATDAPLAEAPAEAAPASDVPPPPGGPTAELTLHPVGDTMEYAETALSVRAGQTVTLTFENTATAEAMSHNVAVLQPGTDVDAFGTAAMSAAETEYIPADQSERVVAHTPVSAPGETVEVTFEAPAPGTYTYVCTFPGHYITMRGTLHVVEA